MIFTFSFNEEVFFCYKDVIMLEARVRTNNPSNQCPLHSIDIYCDGQLVLNIDETSDDETINLFLNPMNSILEKSPNACKFWTHEVLARRE